ncbi:hypothetical protein V6N13_043913 [Hibiscus sabdariffa]
MKENCGVSEVVTKKENSTTEQRNPHELYGSWMQVVNKRRRKVSNLNNSGAPIRSAKSTDNLGSRFDALSEEHENIIDLEDASLTVGFTGSEVEAKESEFMEAKEKVGIENVAGRLHVDMQGKQPEPRITGNDTNGVVKGRSLRMKNTIDGGSDFVGEERTDVLNVTARGKVIAAILELPADKDKAVTVVDNDGGRVPKSTKGQGALNSEFNRSFKLLVKKQQLDIMAILEPQISGIASDNFIKHSGFDCSYRVEAHVFSGGKWSMDVFGHIDKLAAKGRALKLSIVVFTVVPGDVRDLVDDERAQSKLARDSEGVFPYDPGRDLVAI